MTSVVENLKNTSKGRLIYNAVVDMNALMEKLSPPPLSRFHTESLLSKSNITFNLSDPDIAIHKASLFNGTHEAESDHLLTGLSPQSSLGVKLEKNELSLHELQNHTSLRDDNLVSHVFPNKSTSYAQSPDWSLSSANIAMSRSEWESRKQLETSKKMMCFMKHNSLLKDEMEEMQAKSDEHLRSLERQRLLHIEQKQQERLKEAQRQLNEQRERQKKIDTKHKMIEKEKEQMAEEARKRQLLTQQQREENLKKLQMIMKGVIEDKQEFQRLHDGYQHKSHLADRVTNDKQMIETICLDLAAEIQTVDDSVKVLSDMVTRFEEQKTKTRSLLDQLKKFIEEADSKLKAEEDRKKEEEKKKAEASQKKEQAKKQQAEAEKNLTVQALKYILEEIRSKSAKLSEVEASIKPFVDNTQMKSYRFDLQRGVNTPINAISGISGSHLMDKLKRLHMLLSGQRVEITGSKFVSIRDAPEAPLFCQNLVAKMLVKKGEEQVTSKHESAFAIAAVAVGLWVSFPIMGELFVAHLQSLCPYVLPHYPTKQDGQSNSDYYKSAGYKINDDGTVEEQDKFLRRMSGLMRLYAACMVVSPPNLAGGRHPLGLENAWMWLSRTLNLDPQPDITAAMIFDILSVTGHQLFKVYKVQMVKLLFVLYKSYLPTVKSVSVTSATVGRLEVFLENSLKNAAIPPPEGILPPDFWSRS